MLHRPTLERYGTTSFAAFAGLCALLALVILLNSRFQLFSPSMIPVVKTSKELVVPLLGICTFMFTLALSILLLGNLDFQAMGPTYGPFYCMICNRTGSGSYILMFSMILMFLYRKSVGVKFIRTKMMIFVQVALKYITTIAFVVILLVV